MFTSPNKRTALVGLAALGVVALTACGGGGSATDILGKATNETRAVPGLEEFTAAPPSASIMAMQKEGARLNTTELETIAITGVLPKPFEGPLLSGAEGSTAATKNATADPLTKVEQKSAASRTAVYRFYNTQTSAHFFTTSTSERDNVRATLSYMTYEGPAFYASGTTVPGLSPVHRFYNTSTGVHFYTISETERAHVVATLPQFNHEGIAYYASTLAGTGYTPLYRFFYGARGFHFYTNSATEKDNIIATLPQYSYEGVGYYVLGSDWQTPAIPHSGVTGSQCYQAGSDTLVSCASTGAAALNPQQDGHRTAINPMSYSQVISGYFNAFPIALPLYYPKTDCVRDNVTGLIWEGKAASGTRAGSRSFTIFGDNRVGDASEYANTVNASNLCGFNDWRLPSIEELQGLVNYGLAAGLKLDAAWFPNASFLAYWSATANASASGNSFLLDFESGGFPYTTVNALRPVRLVRGAPWSGPRYLVVSVAHSDDSVNNAVVDRLTGLTWRRCLEGQGWSGIACTGTVENYTHEAALIRARDRSGWRLPNVKELSSLADRSQSNPALYTSYFPVVGNPVTWSTSSDVAHASSVWGMFSSGGISLSDRSFSLGVRLVRAND